MRSLLSGLLAIVLLTAVVLIAPPAQATQQEQSAADISAATTYSGSGYGSFGFLKDGNLKNFQNSSANANITMENANGIAGLSLIFDNLFGEYTVINNTTGQTHTAGTAGFLHEYIDLVEAFGQAATSITLQFPEKAVRLSEITAFSAGKLPDSVQAWQAPLDGGADLVLFATHGDDDQLFFAGLLPYYAGELGYRVQVVYMTDHRSGPYATNARIHEMLNGLWNVGVTAYPVFGQFEDFLLEDKQATYDTYLHTYNTTEEDLLSFVVEQIRRFRPLVAVGHDLEGEYRHGMHMVYSDLLVKSLAVTKDASAFPESAAKYGTWELPKLYLHLYGENTVTMDYDQPLAAFDGMTAFEVTQKLGYPCHESQQWTWFTGWINGKHNEITKASQIATYNPCQFGLYHTTVGPDTAKTDLFENITTYAEQERLEQERLEQERLEQERLEQERLEQERLEQERLEQDRLEQERLEQERLEQERLEQERLEQERLEQERKKKTEKLLIACVLLAVLVLALVVILLHTSVQRKRHRQRRKN